MSKELREQENANYLIHEFVCYIKLSCLPFISIIPCFSLLSELLASLILFLEATLFTESSLEVI